MTLQTSNIRSLGVPSPSTAWRASASSLRSNTGREPSIRSGSTVIALPKSLELPAGGGKIEIGVRPQHFTLLQEKMDGAVPATVYAIERLGKENVIVLESENKDTIRVLTGPSVVPSLGERMFAKPDVKKIHHFVS